MPSDGPSFSYTNINNSWITGCLVTDPVLSVHGESSEINLEFSETDAEGVNSYGATLTKDKTTIEFRRLNDVKNAVAVPSRDEVFDKIIFTLSYVTSTYGDTPAFEPKQNTSTAGMVTTATTAALQLHQVETAAHPDEIGNSWPCDPASESLAWTRMNTKDGVRWMGYTTAPSAPPMSAAPSSTVGYQSDGGSSSASWGTVKSWLYAHT